ncbi:MAG: flagellar basal body rod protein FlgB [Clostridiales bacterium]|nr:flagellar basal body rod protein FlgB [Clostridiales bacterium]
MIGNSIASALIQKALDGTWQRQKAIAANIANHETPGYKAVKVSFEEALENEVKRLGTTSMSNGSGNNDPYMSIQNSRIRFLTDQSGSERADGNNVNLESENIDMAKTQIQYQYLTRAMTDFYSRLRYAISEGKR